MSEQSMVRITTFTDPMMGLSYECEPIFRKLETHFPKALVHTYVMSGLVQNVYDFVDLADLCEGKDFAIKKYNARLAKIYEDEESITGMPINMTNFRLFSVNCPSSIPLNIAYKAAELADAENASRFLYNLRYATIAECRPTTRRKGIMAVVHQTGIDENEFCRHFDGKTAKAALERDLMFCRQLGIRTLPAYLLQYREKEVLIQSLIGYTAFVSLLAEITDGELKPQYLEPSLENLKKLINAHPLISPIEIREAFDLSSMEEVRGLISPLLSDGTVRIREVYHGWFIERTEH